MRLVTFIYAEQQHTGLLLGESVLPLAEMVRSSELELDVSTVLGIVRSPKDKLDTLSELSRRASEFSSAFIPLGSVKLLAPIPHPVRNVFCVGRNYLEHIKEGLPGKPTEVALPVVPQFFSKATHAVNAPNGDVRLDASLTSKLDYEVELAVVIGRGGRDISKAAALDHVFGYCVANDFTARDLQRRHDQWFKGKSLDTTFPFGPAIVTKEEINNINDLKITLSVNCELRQHAQVAQMIFDIPAIIEYLSAGLTLESGDIISTGTPSGVGYAMTPPNYLKVGDVVESHIDELGTLRNTIVAA